jgi:hypothetical protein
VSESYYVAGIECPPLRLMVALQNMSVSTATTIHRRPWENISVAIAANGLSILGDRVAESLLRGPAPGMRLLLYVFIDSNDTQRAANSSNATEGSDMSASASIEEERDVPANESSWRAGPWRFLSRDAAAVKASIRFSSDSKDTTGFRGPWGEKLSRDTEWLYSTPSQVIAVLPTEASYFNTVAESIFVTVAGGFFNPGCLGATTAPFQVLTTTDELANAAAVNDAASATSAGLAALLSLASAGDAMSPDIQTLAMISLMRCGNNAQQASTSSMRYMLSPFYDHGSFGVVVGGIASSLGFFVLCGLAVACLRRRPAHAELPWLHCEASRMLWFPRVPFTVASILFCGIAQFSFLGFTKDDGDPASSAGEIVVAVAGVVYCVLFIGVAFLLPRRLVRPTVSFDVYRQSARVQQLSPRKRWVLLRLLAVEGRWDPLAQIHRFAPFFSSMPQTRLCDGWMQHAVTLTIALVTAVPVPKSRCGGVFVALFVIFGAACLAHAVGLRVRCGLLSRLQGLVYFSMAVLAGVCGWNAFDPTPTSGLAVSVVTSIQIFLILCVTVVRASVFFVETYLLPRSVEQPHLFNMPDSNQAFLLDLEEVGDVFELTCREPLPLVASQLEEDPFCLPSMTDRSSDSSSSISGSSSSNSSVNAKNSDLDVLSDNEATGTGSGRPAPSGPPEEGLDLLRANSHHVPTGPADRKAPVSERLRWYLQLKREISRDYNPLQPTGAPPIDPDTL